MNNFSLVSHLYNFSFVELSSDPAMRGSAWSNNTQSVAAYIESLLIGVVRSVVPSTLSVTRVPSHGLTVITLNTQFWGILIKLKHSVSIAYHCNYKDFITDT